MSRIAEPNEGASSIPNTLATCDDPLDRVVAKPWGHEYRIYADALYDAWKLAVEPGHQTSTHLHARKDTALLCLRGRARVRFVDHTKSLEPGDYAWIGMGEAHGTQNDGQDTLELLELEAPRDKLDLVRLHDPYGRQPREYEQESLDRAVPPLVSSPAITGARLRGQGCISGYKVSLGALPDAIERCGPRLIFAVDLGPRPRLQRTLRVLRCPSHSPLGGGGPYLLIERTESEASS